MITDGTVSLVFAATHPATMSAFHKRSEVRPRLRSARRSALPLLLIGLSVFAGFAACARAESWIADRAFSQPCLGPGCAKPPFLSDLAGASSLYGKDGQPMPNAIRGICKAAVPGQPGQFVPGYFDVEIEGDKLKFVRNCVATAAGNVIRDASAEYLHIDNQMTFAWVDTTNGGSYVYVGPGPDGPQSRVCRAHPPTDPVASLVTKNWFVGRESNNACLFAFHDQEVSSGSNYEVLIKILRPQPVPPAPAAKPVAAHPPPAPAVRNCGLPRLGNVSCNMGGAGGSMFVWECQTHCAQGYHGVCQPFLCNSQTFSPQTCTCVLGP